MIQAVWTDGAASPLTILRPEVNEESILPGILTTMKLQSCCKWWLGRQPSAPVTWST